MSAAGGAVREKSTRSILLDHTPFDRRRDGVNRATSRADDRWTTRSGRALFLLIKTVLSGFRSREGPEMNNIIYLIGLIVVILAILGYLGLR